MQGKVVQDIPWDPAAWLKSVWQDQKKCFKSMWAKEVPDTSQKHAMKKKTKHCLSSECSLKELRATSIDRLWIAEHVMDGGSQTTTCQIYCHQHTLRHVELFICTAIDKAWWMISIQWSNLCSATVQAGAVTHAVLPQTDLQKVIRSWINTGMH